MPLTTPLPPTVAVATLAPLNKIYTSEPDEATEVPVTLTIEPAGPEVGERVRVAAETGASGKAAISKARVENTPNTRSKNLCFII